jgi:hypothetical protein
LIWVGNLAADKGGGEACVQHKLPFGRQTTRLSEGGTQRTRLVGVARNSIVIEATKEVGVQFAAGSVKARAGVVQLLEEPCPTSRSSSFSS